MTCKSSKPLRKAKKKKEKEKISRASNPLITGHSDKNASLVRMNLWKILLHSSVMISQIKMALRLKTEKQKALTLKFQSSASHLSNNTLHYGS